MNIMEILLTFTIALLAIPLLLGLKNGFRNINWIEFYTKGKDAGFSFREIGLLRQAAVISRHQKPASLFWSLDVLDKAIAGIHKKKDEETDPEERQYLDFVLKKIYNYRKKIEFQKPRYSRGLESTWEIPLNQILKLKVEMVGVYECSVIENNRNFLLVTYPSGPPVPAGFSWRDKNLNVYFWRKDDAGYFFQASILEGYPDRSFKTLRITHSDVVLRSQKRKSVRTACEIPAQLYPVRNVHTSTILPEPIPGLRCLLQDLSEDGASVLIGGKGQRDMNLKLQFELYGKTVIMRGIVRTVDYDEGKNLSRLHIQAVEPEEESKYLILSFVYNIFRDERTQDIPVNPDESDDFSYEETDQEEFDLPEGVETGESFEEEDTGEEADSESLKPLESMKEENSSFDPDEE